jgi:hypothetical protein
VARAQELLMRNAVYFFYGLLVNIPSFLTALVCILIALFRWKRHPRVSLLVVLSLIWLTLHSLVFEAIFFFGPQWLLDQGQATSLDTFYIVTSLIYNIMAALALGLLLLAVFGQRSPAQHTV